MGFAIGASLTEPFSADEMNQQGKGFGLGDRYETHDGKVYVFVQADGAITGDGYAVAIDEDYQAVMMDTDTAATVAEGLIVGVAESAFSDEDYGFVQIYGACGVLTAAEAAANTKQAPTSTAGELDDAGAAGTKYVDGLILNTATPAGSSAVNDSAFLNFPKLALVGTYA